MFTATSIMQKSNLRIFAQDKLKLIEKIYIYPRPFERRCLTLKSELFATDEMQFNPCSIEIFPASHNSSTFPN